MPDSLDILLVEDNPLDAQLLLRELQRAGTKVHWQRVETEKDYLAALRGDLDIVLSDFELPQFNGLRALELLKQSGFDLPFILISGTIGEDLAVTAIQEGASDYLMKDRLGRLGTAVARAIEQKRLEREARRADAALRANAAFVNDVLNSLTAAVVVLDESGVITATNETWRRFARENGGGDGLNQNYLEVCIGGLQGADRADAQAAHDGIQSVLRGTRKDFTMEYACHSPTEQRWILMRVSPLGGARRGAVVAHEKITELKQAELTLRESEDRFRRLIENASDVIVVINEDGVAEFASPSVKRTLGFEPAEVTGRHIVEFLHPDDHATAIDALGLVHAEPGKPRTAEYRIRHRDGSWRIFQSVGKSMLGPKGERLAVVNSRDVTETHRLEEQFLRAQRLEAIGTLSSGVAHDLNNILAPMLMVAPLLREKLPDPQDGELLTMIEHAAQRGANIIRQLLTFSRGVEGKRTPVQPRYLLKEMIEIMRETFPREIAVVEKTPGDLWPITADATQIHQVLLNLCVNARDAMRDGGTLTVSAENLRLDEPQAAAHAPLQAGPFVCLKIEDTGEGIARENLNRIFEPFFTTKEIGKGTGLGLSTVLGIVKSHDGLITVESERGRGTTFRVFLPAITEGWETTSPDAATAPARGEGEFILIVDDERPIRRALRLILEESNYQVLEADDGKEAMAVFLGHRDLVRVVLTDVMMPGMNGVALVRALRSIAPQLPVIAASGLHDDVRTEQLAAFGVTNIVAKPCTSREILEALRRALAGAAQN